MLEARGWARRVAEERRLCTQAQSDFVEIEAEGPQSSHFWVREMKCIDFQESAAYPPFWRL